MQQRIKSLRKSQEGFTIIEVMIVLAIAGLIMLIVFLAVPALQRSQRNNARNTEASRIAAAINECLSNRNGTIASCDTEAEINYTASTDNTNLASTIVFTNGGTTAPTNSTTGAGVWFGKACPSDGSQTNITNGTTRQFVVLYNLEPAIAKCISA